MGNRIDKTLQAEYKGFKFLVLSEDERGGRKVPVFEIPNSNSRIMQDLGGLPQDFSITAIIAGDNYIQDAKKFVSILLESEPGTLILPVFGFNEVKCIDYSRSSDNSSIGKISFSIRFNLFDMAGAVFEEVPTVQDVYNNYLETMNALADSLMENWDAPKTNANRLSAVNDAKSFYATCKDAFKGISTAVRAVDNAVGMINTAINSAEMYADLFVREGALAVVASAVGLGQEYQTASDIIDFGKDLPSRLSELGSTIASGFDSMNASDDKDFSIPLWSQNKTRNWNQRNKNRVLTIESARFQALSLMLYQSTGLNFGNLDDLINVKMNLQSYFVALTAQKDGIINNNQEFIDKLLILKESVFKIFNEKEKNVYRITEIEVENMSPIALAYLLYVDEVKTRDEIMKKADILISLNDGMQIFNGKIKVLQR